VGDSGELVAAVHTLGIPHPSGYPLYVLLGKLWTLALPVGSVAARMSWFSVVAAALAVGGLYVLGRRLALERWAAALASLSLALAPSFWSQANVQRVYALNALFVVAAFLWALAWERRGSRGRLWMALLLAGLGASNHTFMALQGVAIAVWAWWRRPEARRDARLWLGGAVSFGLGLAPYLFLMLRSRADPLLDWGDPETPLALARHALRATHWSRAWLDSWLDLGPIGWDFLWSLGREFLWLGIPLVVAGLFAAQRRRWPLALMMAIVVLNVGAMAAHGSRTDLFVWHRYYIPAYVMAALWLGAGGLAGSSLAGAARRAALLLWLIPVGLLVTGWRDHDRSRFTLAEDYSRWVLAGLPPGSHLAASDDNILFVLIYLSLVEGARPDVDLIMQGVGDAELPPLRFDPERNALHFTHHPNWRQPGIELVPSGLTFRVRRAGAGGAETSDLPEFLPGELDPRVPKDYLTQNLLGNFHYMRGLEREHAAWPAAVGEFERAAQAAPANDVLFYNLGLILQRRDRLALARLAFERAHAINPRGIVSQRTALASDRVRALDAELERSPERGKRPMSEEESRLAAALRARGWE
jgi:tetratricopeptide (TPR) repeat protein